MRERYRLNLEAPFLRAAADPMQPEMGVSSELTFQRPANDVPAQSAKADFGTDRHLRRPPVPQRGQADYGGATMARYINGLESRLTDHISRHAPRWHAQETSRILARWAVPGAAHPAPSWAPPRNVQADARDYAGHLVRERIVARIQRLHDIRLTRTLADLGGVEPQPMRFHSQETAPSKKIRQSM